MDKAELPVWAQQLITLAAIIGAAVAAIWQGRKSKPPTPTQPSGEAQVVTATFMDRQSIRDLEQTVRALHGTLTKLVDLLEAEAHRREVEGEVRQVLKDRGLIP